jgi:hypothetical protein
VGGHSSPRIENLMQGGVESTARFERNKVDPQLSAIGLQILLMLVQLLQIGIPQ